MNCIYEVTLHIDPELIGAYDPWLREHVAQMLALPGFVNATIYALEATNDHEPTVGRVVHYTLADRAAFDDYLRDHAAHMREQGIARFGDRVSASRRILLTLD